LEKKLEGKEEQGKGLDLEAASSGGGGEMGAANTKKNRKICRNSKEGDQYIHQTIQWHLGGRTWNDRARRSKEDSEEDTRAGPIF